MFDISRKLRVFLADNDVKYKDFAKEIGVSKETVSHWCKVDTKINIWHAARINEFSDGQITMEDMGH